MTENYLPLLNLIVSKEPHEPLKFTHHSIPTIFLHAQHRGTGLTHSHWLSKLTHFGEKSHRNLRALYARWNKPAPTQYLLFTLLSRSVIKMCWLLSGENQRQLNYSLLPYETFFGFLHRSRSSKRDFRETLKLLSISKAVEVIHDDKLLDQCFSPI